MRSGACPRSSEAEAMRDQRMEPAERASFERHLGGCSACAREVRELEALAAPLRDAAGLGADGDQLHARRERARLLQAFEQSTAVRARPRARLRLRTWPLAAAAVVLVAAGAGGLRMFTSRAPAARIAVHADTATVWSGRVDGPHPRLVLQRGSLFVRVRSSDAQAAPLRVVLPDGELEDIGTVFTVRVDDGHTTRVSVREGSVLLRVRGESTRVIGAGETWMREEPGAAEAARAGEGGPGVSPGAAMSGAPGGSVVAAHEPAPPRPALRRSSVRLDPAGDFRAAIALFEAGEHRAAAAAFARFTARHPRDARGEDAAYLRVLALHRAGDRRAAGAAAREYLRDHPAGLRRVEVERLAD